MLCAELIKCRCRYPRGISINSFSLFLLREVCTGHYVGGRRRFCYFCSLRILNVLSFCYLRLLYGICFSDFIFLVDCFYLDNFLCLVDDVSIASRRLQTRISAVKFILILMAAELFLKHYFNIFMTEIWDILIWIPIILRIALYENKWFINYEWESFFLRYNCAVTEALQKY